jgi:catechol 2,3-dioxygenase-like lactoylglutathione lyase family enzyme
MAITGMNHFTVLTADLSRTLRFYVELLGLRLGPRPPLPFAGAWLYAGEQAVLHVIAGSAPPVDARGALDHMAFSATDLASVAARLEREGVTYELKRQHGSRMLQLFVVDPSGARVELLFDSEESLPNGGQL